jgi:uncharacterized protein (DUF488 family)
VPPPVPRIWTVGHSTREIGEFASLLAAHRITLLIDVRTIPRSMRNPQFNRDVLPPGLEAAGIGYLHLPALGGLRRPVGDSANAGWRNESFRGFADYMLTPGFDEALAVLIEDIRAASAAGRSPAHEARAALMCAEAVPWRCHRSLIADALTVRGIEVLHIIGPSEAHPHRLTSFAHVEGTRVTYPGEATLL